MADPTPLKPDSDSAIPVCTILFYSKKCWQSITKLHIGRPKKSCLFPVTLPLQDFIRKNPYPKFLLPSQLPINVKHA